MKPSHSKKVNANSNTTCFCNSNRILENHLTGAVFSDSALVYTQLNQRRLN